MSDVALSLAREARIAERQAVIQREPRPVTHDVYLESHHELSNSGFDAIALMLAKGNYEDATTAMTNLRALLDALWEARREVAERGVRP